MQLLVDRLLVRRGERTVIEGLSFAVTAGEALELTGPNGAGKTTLLKTIAGLIAPASGTVRLEGGADEQEIGEQCHFVGHRDAIKGSLTVAENARFWSQYLTGGGNGSDGRPVPEALAMLGIEALAAVPAAWLSAGQRRRLGLVRLVLAERPLWLLDEPSVSLDSAGVETLVALVQAHLAAGGMAIAATHVPLGLRGARGLSLG